MTRSVLAVVAGFLLIVVLSLGTDVAVRAAFPGSFEATGRTDSVPLLVATLVYVGVYAVAGCYLTACLAPSRPMRHALILGALGLAFSVAGTANAWHTAPAWYHVVALLLVLPYAWLGGRLGERERAGRGTVAA